MNPSVFDDMVHNSISAHIDVLASVPSAEFLDTARQFVRDMLTLCRPDGSTPDAELIQEVLRSVLDEMDACVTEESRRGPGPPNRRAWITAWRECAHNIALLERMLAEIESPTDVGVPPASPIADDRLMIKHEDGSTTSVRLVGGPFAFHLTSRRGEGRARHHLV